MVFCSIGRLIISGYDSCFLYRIPGGELEMCLVRQEYSDAICSECLSESRTSREKKCHHICLVEVMEDDKEEAMKVNLFLMSEVLKQHNPSPSSLSPSLPLSKTLVRGGPKGKTSNPKGRYLQS